MPEAADEPLLPDVRDELPPAVDEEEEVRLDELPELDPLGNRLDDWAAAKPGNSSINERMNRFFITQPDL